MEIEFCGRVMEAAELDVVYCGCIGVTIAITWDCGSV